MVSVDAPLPGDGIRSGENVVSKPSGWLNAESCTSAALPPGVAVVTFTLADPLLVSVTPWKRTFSGIPIDAPPEGVGLLPPLLPPPEPPLPPDPPVPPLPPDPPEPLLSGAW